MTAPDFSKSFEVLMDIEKEWADVKGDPGGRTVWGISERWHPEVFKLGPPTRDQAHHFYHYGFWKRLRLDELLCGAVAYRIFDTAVNCGRDDAQVYAQRAYNLLCPDDWIALEVDGWIGDKSLFGLNRMITNYPEAILEALEYEQAHHYAQNGDRQFIRGWFARIARGKHNA